MYSSRPPRKRSEPQNVTIDDSNSTIRYRPTGFWWTNEEVQNCGECLDLGIHADAGSMFNQTFHLGIRNASSSSTTSTSITPASTSSTTPASTAASSTQTQDSNQGKGKGKGKGGGGGGGGGDDDGGGGGGGHDDHSRKRAVKNPDEIVHSLPVNLSFTLDNTPVGSFAPGVASTTNNVLALENLPEEPHVLIATLAPESIFLFDYLVYTTTLSDGTMSSSSESLPSYDMPPPSPTPTLDSDSQSSSDSHSNKTATYAGAIGGVVGALFLASMGVFISVYRRRRKFARRNRPPPLATSGPGMAQNFGDADHGLITPPSSASTTAGDPEMGFVPRYFPGTVVRDREREMVPPPYEVPPGYASDLDLSGERRNGAGDGGEVGAGADIGVAGRRTLVNAPTPSVTVTVDESANTNTNTKAIIHDEAEDTTPNHHPNVTASASPFDHDVVSEEHAHPMRPPGLSVSATSD
ncbi:hypothetical protein V5O48_003193 [Marasmius crinis-equi]|uniref:Uncharacterized protein n=1 Tax=Marasmius crinis-equi TaxID=585013 RepID=A0ABR3FTH5_9AGAR